jgi:hypothetical protein
MGSGYCSPLDTATWQNKCHADNPPYEQFPSCWWRGGWNNSHEVNDFPPQEYNAGGFSVHASDGQWNQLSAQLTGDAGLTAGTALPAFAFECGGQENPEYSADSGPNYVPMQYNALPRGLQHGTMVYPI